MSPAIHTAAPWGLARPDPGPECLLHAVRRAVGHRPRPPLVCRHAVRQAGFCLRKVTSLLGGGDLVLRWGGIYLGDSGVILSIPPPWPTPIYRPPSGGGCGQWTHTIPPVGVFRYAVRVRGEHPWRRRQGRKTIILKGKSPGPARAVGVYCSDLLRSRVLFA